MLNRWTIVGGAVGGVTLTVLIAFAGAYWAAGPDHGMWAIITVGLTLSGTLSIALVTIGVVHGMVAARDEGYQRAVDRIEEMLRARETAPVQAAFMHGYELGRSQSGRVGDDPADIARILRFPNG